MLLPVTRAFCSNVDLEYPSLDARFFALVSLRRTSCAPEFEELRREKQELARTWRAVRQAELKANGDSVRVRGLVLGRRQQRIIQSNVSCVLCMFYVRNKKNTLHNIRRGT